MLEILEYNVYGLENAERYSGLPMTTDLEDLTSSEKRMEKLCNAKPGSGHDNVAKGILVTALIKYPTYWTTQFQRYHFADIISSQSKMHRLNKFDISESCNKYVDYRSIEILNEKVQTYNFILDNKLEKAFVCNYKHFETYEGAEEFFDSLICKEGEEYILKTNIYMVTKYEAFMEVVSNCPQGFELTMAITTNYLQLKTIYEQRKHHKLAEDWGAFAKWCEELPKFSEYCLSGKLLFS